MIHKKESGWENMVPHKVASEIKKRRLFKYEPEEITEAKEA